jgi:hypothetical protein
VFAAAEGNFAETGLLRFGERSADHGKGLGLDVVLGDDEVGLLQVLGREFVERDELGDVYGVLGRDAQVGNLGGLNDDVLAFAVLIPFDDLILFDGCGRFVGRLLQRGGEYLLVTDALAGRARDLMEANLSLGLGGNVEFDRTSKDVPRNTSRGLMNTILPGSNKMSRSLMLVHALADWLDVSPVLLGER